MKPSSYFIFLLLSILFLIAGYITSEMSLAIDAHIKDTLFVLSVSFLCFTYSLWTFITWLIYLLLKKFLKNKIWIWTHAIIFLAFIGLQFSLVEQRSMASYVSYSDLNDMIRRQHQAVLAGLIALATIIFIPLQLLVNRILLKKWNG